MTLIHFSVHRLVSVSVALLLFCVQTAIQAQTTVKVGSEIKPASGTILSQEIGDTACYISLRDDKGVEFTEMADFDLCDRQPRLTGKRVGFGYAQAKVMAESCGGDPACKKTRTVAIINSVKRLDGPLSSPVSKNIQRGQASFCSVAETTVFSCRAGAKMISVCADAGSSPKQGYLQYRFGKPDSLEALEMNWPENWIPPASASTGGTLSFSGGGGAWLRVRKGDHAYVVYTGIGKWGPNGQTLSKEGVSVERRDKVIASIKCSNHVSSLLGPEWFDKMGIEAHGEEFDLPD